MKTALVTGASRGIGQAISRKLALDGFRIIAVARDANTLQQLISSLEPPRADNIYYAADLEDPASLAKFLDFVVSNDIHLDTIVNNLGGSLAIPSTAPAEDWQRVWWFNVGIGHEINRTFIPEMADRGWGRIIHISTLSTRSFGGYAPYVSAKCALEGYVRTMARELVLKGNDNVVVSGVAPGAIRVEGRFLANLGEDDPEQLRDLLTREIKTNRLGEASEVAQVVSFLASDNSTYMNGSIVEVSGGA